MISFVVVGKVRGKARPRPGRVSANGKRAWYVPTQEYQDAVGWAAKFAMGKKKPITGPVGVRVEITIGNRKAYQRGDVCTVKPDGDNVLKLVKDAMNGVAYVDDKQVVLAEVSKRYGSENLLSIQVWPIS